ncbi:NUDIX hydrolase [Staphylococcus simiae]|uniref:MutT domain-containing protein n=1 Tax=Staphylococcus simiae CCM 7213 = CCUG 51256 TaxID=911238 RepID=G5JJJ4_9STAP|nr:NUDIX domain-containing protein [Staphylococcus simiae]EHJ07642.1 MutT domain-containing protein [Staphylococcus simiae CCM 7213 = CCUG 51256]PNZ10977.1 NUDIX domain-containing protein [Staphylococcus simiae]SNV60928.1 MutT domain containing protein [Staphylococcus simiae]
MIKCVCLVAETKDQILLVQVRHGAKYYFPGGKIEAGEGLVEALIRELDEELNLTLRQEDLEFIGTVVGPAYPQPNTLTELNGFRALIDIDWDDIAINNEITDIKWIDKQNSELIAPAVQQWIAQGIN